SLADLAQKSLALVVVDGRPRFLAAAQPRQLLLELIGDQKPCHIPRVFVNTHLADDRNLAILTTGKDRRHAVIILLADRIEFMIVASRAAERQPEKCRPGSIHRIGLPLGTKLIAEKCILS